MRWALVAKGVEMIFDYIGVLSFGILLVPKLLPEEPLVLIDKLHLLAHVPQLLVGLLFCNDAFELIVLLEQLRQSLF